MTQIYWNTLSQNSSKMRRNILWNGFCKSGLGRVIKNIMSDEQGIYQNMTNGFQNRIWRVQKSSERHLNKNCEARRYKSNEVRYQNYVSGIRNPMPLESIFQNPISKHGGMAIWSENKQRYSYNSPYPQ